MIGPGWGGYTIVGLARLADPYASGDPGIVAKDSAGNLWYYPSAGGNGITPDKRTKRSLFDFPTGISPQGHIFGEQVRQRGHLATLSRLQKPGEHLLVGFGRGREAWSMLSQMVLRPAERAATGRFTLVKHGGNLGKLILEDFAQQEDSSLEGLELLQQHQERQRDRLMHIDALCRIECFGSHGGKNRLW